MSQDVVNVSSECGSFIPTFPTVYKTSASSTNDSPTTVEVEIHIRMK